MVKINQTESEISPEYMIEFDYRAPQSSPNNVVTEKYLESNYPFEKVKSDNIVKSTANYVKKYFNVATTLSIHKTFTKKNQISEMTVKKPYKLSRNFQR